VDFKQIEAFISVAKFKSFSKAAEAIYLSQPTVSTHINSLENELSVLLFDRSGKDIQLTPAGLLFYDYAINMFNTRNGAIQSIAEFYNKIEGELHIAASTTPCRSILPGIISSFSEKYQKVIFKISEQSSGQVISSIINFDAEIGIVGKKVYNSRLLYTELVNDDLVLITPKGGRFDEFTEDSLNFNEVLNENIILRDLNSATRQIFEAALISANYNINKLKIFCQVSSMDTAIQFVRYGLGVTVISEDAVKDYLDYNLIKRFYLKDLQLKRKIYMVKYEKRTLSPAAKMFEKHALSCFSNNKL